MNFVLDFLKEQFLVYRCRARYDLERKVFPNIRDKKVLLVGMESYNFKQIKKLEKNDNWVFTIEIEPKQAKYGSKWHHTIGSIVNIDKHFPKNFFDYIIIHGVLGYGLDTEEEAEKMFKNCYKVLKPGGVLILGWDDSIPNIPTKLKNFKLFKQVSLFGFEKDYRVPDPRLVSQIDWFYLQFLKKEKK